MNLYEGQPDLNIENMKIYAWKIKNDRKYVKYRLIEHTTKNPNQ